MRLFSQNSSRFFLVAFVLPWLVPTLALAQHPKPSLETGWRPLFNGKDLTGWVCPPGSWVVEDGAIAWKGGGYLTSIEQYDNFILDLEFKVSPKANSGIIFRHLPNPDSKKPYWWDGLLEIQIFDSFGKPIPDKHDCGALYDMVAPTKNMVHKPGTWNRLTLVANDSRIAAMLNGQEILNVDLNNWSKAGKNPDGTPNKYHRAMKDLPPGGFLLFQDHGSPVWFRNIFIKPLE